VSVVDERTPSTGWIDQGRVLSGAVHYFRVHPALWEDRLRRLAAMGATHVETYVPWNFHERERGRFDFEGWRDLTRFVHLAEQAGLAVIVRPGPFICAEWDNGGLPAWLLYDGPIPVRTSDARFLEPVDAWFDALIPRLVPLLRTHGGPIVAVQVENEYGSFGSDRAYLEHLREGLRARGIDVPLFTSDGPTDLMLDAGSLPGAAATANFGSAAVEAMRVLDLRRPGDPFLCAEFWVGWFDHWGREHHTRPAEDMAAAIEPLLDGGGSVNIYMAHGGTSFGTWPGANIDQGVYLPTVTSYDSDAPIGEAGELTDKYWELRRLFGSARGVRLPEPPPLPERQPARRVPLVPGAALLAALRSSATAAVRTSALPLSQEQLRQPAGLTLYEAELLIPAEGTTLRVLEPRDRAWVFLDGVLIHRVDRNVPDEGVPLAGAGTAARLSIVVENEGRVNFGRHVGEEKGLLGGASLDAHGVSRLVHGWSQWPVDMQSLTELPEIPTPSPGESSGVYRAELACDRPADAFIALPGWEKVYVWLNGFLLGRLDSRGPQGTLYAPGALWLKGDNVVEVLSLGVRGGELQIEEGPRLDSDGADFLLLNRD